jgi:unsaturated rhamnogalacturonyl hydrolase
VSSVTGAAGRVSNARLRAAADVLLDYPFRVWHYGESVGVEGLLRIGSLLDEPRYEAWVHGLLRGWAARRRPFAELDNTLPGKVLCELAERHGDELLLEAAADAAAQLRGRPTLGGVAVPFERAPLRAPFGGAPLSPRERALLEDPGPGVFVDPLHFDPPFLVHLGALTGSAELVDAGAEQARALVALLQDDSGAFWHFHLERTGERYGLGWGRGQGWALLGLVDVLERLPNEHPDRRPLQAALLRLAQVLRRTQRDDGGWWAVISDPGSGPERSTAAFVAAGFSHAVAVGLLPRDHLACARAAWEHTARGVRDDGVLADVSANVWACTAAWHYAHVPLGAVVPWGQGPLLLAAAEHLNEEQVP